MDRLSNVVQELTVHILQVILIPKSSILLYDVG